MENLVTLPEAAFFIFLYFRILYESEETIILTNEGRALLNKAVIMSLACVTLEYLMRLNVLFIIVFFIFLVSDTLKDVKAKIKISN